MSLEQRLTQAWQRRGPLALLLWPLSLVYGALIALRRLGYRHGWLRSEHPGVPVVVVGNRIVGGAGKTPVVIALAEHLRQRGMRPGIISRGHGRADVEDIRAVHADDPVDAVGDEPLLLALRTAAPVFVGRDRAATARALRAAHPEVDVILSDDGAQHLALARDIEILVFDARGAGNGWLLPAGPLREPLAVASTARHALVLYSGNEPSTPLAGSVSSRGLRGLVELGDWWAGRAATAQALAALAQRSRAAPEAVFAGAGIARPQAFFEMLAAAGVRAAGLPLADHERYAELPWPAAARELVVTEKDAVKLRPDRLALERPGLRVWVAPLDFEPEAAFWPRLDAALDDVVATAS
ncbi:tetraacyldisaccharide 4'-kinase [Rivibacter subsaxonicus]|uniref:Tetraacyldisaccharide 4'-kinase n=1 Tax=Rivibacter subsaxonicus TaxID=457575 RepID=A0A4V2FTF7_9BURK|nr:tetraacyldisaccharide 4'-kinase [Rivibacter subsaxonicus]RZT97965.1 lipid-A-disaccharide kinase [Rivibacter subsaxonicus]